ncbi:MAG TPA: DUF445 domain-containing protein [Gemmatimonadaceae bacterium]|nr:DUF445 domain-containing protein [Gemmatimonadaceae bacterium]
MLPETEPRSVPPPQLAAVPDEVERQRRLDQMKARATGLLVLATVIYIVTRLLEPRYEWLGFLRAMAEAAMIGGLADWFAVTALFRHPMGIPIPHTAIIPARKDRVARTLGAFVQHNFLTREVIQARLAGIHVGERIARWVAQPENARTIARQTATALAAGAQVLKDDDVQELIDHTLEERIRRARIAPIAGKILSVVTEDNRHQELLDEAIVLISRSVEQNHDLIRDRVQRESPWWVPTAVDEKIFEKIVMSIERTLREIRDDPNHPLRERFDSSLRTFIDNLQNSPDTVAKAEALKAELLDAEAVRRFSASLWVDAKAALIRFAENAEATSKEGGTIERALTSFGEAVLADPSLMQRVDDFVVDIAAQMVERYQREIADLITHTVQNWDADVTTRRIELAIGRDLQYIRINGTLVGALAGLLIYSISRLLP